MIRRYKLSTCLNMRDIGGYQGISVTKYNEFFRSDDVSLCTDTEVEYLYSKGVRTIIDLRGAGEIQLYPSTFSMNQNFKYFHISLMSEEKYGGMLRAFSLGEMYIDVVENKQIINELFTTIAENLEGITIYHCTAGKDRTGIVTCLLLMLAGVDKYDIAADYEVSNTYLTQKIVAFSQAYPDMPQHMFKSNPELIMNIYDHIITKYTNIDNYLSNAGISDDYLLKIRRKICMNY